LFEKEEYNKVLSLDLLAEALAQTFPSVLLLKVTILKIARVPVPNRSSPKIPAIRDIFFYFISAMYYRL